MKDLNGMTVEELKQLINNAQDEISSRTGFDAEFEVSGKAINPCTYKQIQFAQKLASETGSEILINNSQLQKRFEMSDMSEAIDLMKDGNKIKIS